VNDQQPDTRGDVVDEPAATITAAGRARMRGWTNSTRSGHRKQRRRDLLAVSPRNTVLIVRQNSMITFPHMPPITSAAQPPTHDRADSAQPT
jgi:hypothetical protein